MTVAVAGKPFVGVMVACSAWGPDRKAATMIAAREPAAPAAPASTPTAVAADLQSLEAASLVLMLATTL